VHFLFSRKCLNQSFSAGLGLRKVLQQRHTAADDSMGQQPIAGENTQALGGKTYEENVF
jgi:hypothetical protein